MSNPLASADRAMLNDIPLPNISEAASGRHWVLRDADLRIASHISQSQDLDPILARVLAARGVKAETAAAYLNPSLRASMPDPSVLLDMDRAADRIAKAILEGVCIGVFGDYDVDGVTAASLLRNYFSALGIEMPVYLPDRIAEGYGPSGDAFLALKDAGAEIIVTVDCGANSHEAIDAAAAAGIEIIVFDHHLMASAAPKNALATVNPNRPDDISGLTNLSAAGVAFMGIVAINRTLRKLGYFELRAEPDLTQYLDLAALGLVCDVMEMTGFTRVLVAQGLKRMDAQGNQGLRALADRAGAKGSASAYHLGFLVGPRINAAGRIGHAKLAFDLLTTDNAEKRRALVERLHLMNAERQAIEAEVQSAALAEIERSSLNKDPVIVVAGEGWHPGVIGIVAGRIKEKFDRPAIVIGLDGDTGKGSGRSITGVDLGAAIGQLNTENYLIAGGGHAMAAGLTIAADQIGRFRDTVNDRLRLAVDHARAERRLSVDAVISADAVTAEFAKMIERAGPYGPGNPEPVFAITDLRVSGTRPVGENHLSVTLKTDSGRNVRAIAFRAVDEPLGAVLTGAERVHVVGKVRADDWRGGDAGQLQISDAAPA